MKTNQTPARMRYPSFKEELYHYSNGSIAPCEDAFCVFDEHGTLTEVIRAMREDPFNAPYRPRGAL